MARLCNNKYSVVLLVVGLGVALVEILLLLHRMHVLTGDKHALMQQLRALEHLHKDKEKYESKSSWKRMFAGVKIRRQNEPFDITPYDSFTYQTVFSVNKDGANDEPSRTIKGERLDDHQETLKFAVNHVNKKLLHKGQYEQITKLNLVNGISKLDRAYGMEYDFIFKIPKSTDKYERVKVYRPYNNIQLRQSIESFSTLKRRVNVIIPLSGRQAQLKLFLKHFGDCCLQLNVYLTVVYFGDDGKQDVINSLKEFEKKKKFRNYKVIFSNAYFSRGVGLQTGVLSWSKGNDIMFFCDVDVYFDASFIDRCRFYTDPGKMVYFPIVFSLYNPETVYYSNIPDIKRRLFAKKGNGLWVDFGFGMSCIYRDDFTRSKGFNTSIKGWGGEDVALFRKFINTNITVIRATDRGLFHIYHPKNCDPNLTKIQYLSCMTVKARLEGSHVQMSRLAFGSNLFSDKQPDWKTKMKIMKLQKDMNEIDVAIAEIKSLKVRIDSIKKPTSMKDKNTSYHADKLRELKKSLDGVLLDVRKLSFDQTNDTIK
ncbi:chondroitin sulfate N-acetylgalactosaminyltransferase 1-like [Xenia sp. Carnegie-2017]|uniref:chondroitin sulfate N-acetylgalactosaminyltransferase 1-like n=1 Tax=Xenia sp. Carnegie-2017 TaxID=2897299 RepID=UPI001F033187|nr:chondroitin sulfate N-acetylgalactosaminyltransferase 1-like [Xenia sp. Carnegie-2017]